MREPMNLVRRTMIAVAMVAITSLPLAAQATTNSNTTSTAGIVAQQDTTRRDNDRGFPWGLLGLLGLAGLLGRRREETVRTVPPSTTRTGDVGSRM
jgi:MYXO-CTERM domain-containing protein